ncbi:MAG: hypothetical protein DRP71_12700 [Verrucomicrobia bacterium]|nr:MAG: hypothetical protein DRP71_12700 [Verrucomicrobiota bacterium]
MKNANSNRPQCNVMIGDVRFGLKLHYTRCRPLDTRGKLTIIEHYLTPLELLDRLAQLITPPRIHKHRYCGIWPRTPGSGRWIHPIRIIPFLTGSGINPPPWSLPDRCRLLNPLIPLMYKNHLSIQ